MRSWVLEDRQVGHTDVVKSAGDQVTLDLSANCLPADPQQRSDERSIVSWT
jgi:hypothetical protein